MSDIENNAYVQSPEKFTLLDLFHVLVKHRFLILVSTGLAAVLIFIFALYTAAMPDESPLNPMPNYYSPRVKVMIQQTDEGIGGNISSGSGALGLLLGGGLGANQNVILVKELLAGNSIKDRIIERFNFTDRYELQASRSPKSAAREKFDESFEVIASEAVGSNVSGGNLLVLSYTDEDKFFATEIVNEILILLEERFKQLSLEKLERKKEFIEERLRVTENALSEGRNALVDFQLTHGTLDLSSQAREQAQLIADMSADLLKKEFELQTLKEYLDENNPRIVLARQEIDKMRKLIEELKTGRGDLPADYIPQNRIPSLTFRYLELQGELKVQESIYSMLREQYEVVKIDIDDNSRVLQVIEPAEVPELKSGPSRGKLCVLTTIAVFLLSAFWAFIKEYFENKKKDPKESHKLSSIKSMLSFKRSKAH